MQPMMYDEVILNQSSFAVWFQRTRWQLLSAKYFKACQHPNKFLFQGQPTRSP
jgi:hypothetical protein